MTRCVERVTVGRRGAVMHSATETIVTPLQVEGIPTSVEQAPGG